MTYDPQISVQTQRRILNLRNLDQALWGSNNDAVPLHSVGQLSIRYIFAQMWEEDTRNGKFD